MGAVRIGASSIDLMGRGLARMIDSVLCGGTWIGRDMDR